MKFYTSQVVEDFFHQQYHQKNKNPFITTKRYHYPMTKASKANHTLYEEK